MANKELLFGAGAAGMGVLALILHSILKSRNRPKGFETLPMSAGPGILQRMSVGEQMPLGASQATSAPPKASVQKPAATKPFSKPECGPGG